MVNTTKSIIIAFVLSLAALSVGIWIFLYSPFGMGGLRAIAPTAELPDTIDSPSVEVYRQVIENMGENGRKFYLHNIRMIDTIFPFLYTLPLYILLSAAIRRVFRRPFIQQSVPILAFMPAMFDLLENHYLHQLVHDFPEMQQSIVEKVLLFTQTKAITRDAIFYIVLIYWTAIGLLHVIKYLRKKIHVNVFQAVLFCAMLAFPLPLFAQNSVSYDQVDAYIQQKMDSLNIPGASLAIVENGEIAHLRGFGQARPDGEAPAPDTPFMIGSLTKSFTALAVMQLVEAGKIDLDAPVQLYLPWFRVADPQASALITVRHLLNQTSGLSESSGRIPLADFDTSPDATERQARALSAQKLIHPVGTAFEYSNSNYNLLGLIIAAVSGETYADYVQNHIFTPLDMRHSYTSQEFAKQHNLAMGHQYWFAVPIAAPGLPVPQGSLPSGQIISSAEDIAHYLIAYLNGGHYDNAHILSSAGIDELRRGVAEFTQMGMSFGKYGMGWFDDEIGQTTIAWHTGIVPDFFAYMALLPERKQGVVLFFNAYGYLMTPALSEVGTGVATLLAGQQPAPSQVGFMPWVMRSLLLIPLLQIIGVVLTLRRRLRRWRYDPASRPGNGRTWGLHILLPLLPNLLVALTLIPMLGAIRGFWMLFMPDFAWIALICGSFAGIWIFLRTGLILRILRKSQASKTSPGGSEHIR